MAADNKEISRRVFEDVWNNQNIDAVEDLMSRNYVHHDPSSPDVKRGTEGYKQFVREYLRAFPDIHFTIHDHIAEGDAVVSHWSASGTHKGELRDIAATGRNFTVTGTTIARVRDGKFVESWSNWDALGLMQQLGIVPALGQAKERAA
jgi:steroid delta-isomerase-like uncharacterized protein